MMPRTTFLAFVSAAFAACGGGPSGPTSSGSGGTGGCGTPGGSPAYYSCACQSDCQAGTVCTGSAEHYCKPTCSGASDCTQWQATYPTVSCEQNACANGAGSVGVCNDHPNDQVVASAPQCQGSGGGSSGGGSSSGGGGGGGGGGSSGPQAPGCTNCTTCMCATAGNNGDCQAISSCPTCTACYACHQQGGAYCTDGTCCPANAPWELGGMCYAECGNVQGGCPSHCD